MNPLRYELKLVCEAHRLFEVYSWLRLHPAGLVVAFPPRQVNSLYWDTPQQQSLHENLGGYDVRNKLRWRWYGPDLIAAQPLLEIKHKRGLLGFKKQFLLPCTVDMTRPWREIFKRVYANVGEEWRPFLQQFARPMLLNYYQREYYVTPDGAVRVTLDSGQTVFDQRLTLRPSLMARLPVDDTLIIEIKADHDQAARVQDIVYHFPLSRNRNSKYAGGMLAALSSQ